MVNNPRIPMAFSRISTLRTLPEIVIGKLSVMWTYRGILNLASFPSLKARMSSAVSVRPSATSRRDDQAMSLPRTFRRGA